MTSIHDLITTLYGKENQRHVVDRKHLAISRYIEMSSELLRFEFPTLGTPVTWSVSTPFAKPQSLAYSEVEYIVFDQSLGQTFSLLNQLAKRPASPETFFSVMYILLAQRHMIAGRFREAACLCIYASEFTDIAGAEMAAWSKQISYDDVELVEMQEFFVLAHELAHTCVRTDQNITQEKMAALATYVRSGNEYFRNLQIDSGGLHNLVQAKEERLEKWMREMRVPGPSTAQYRHQIIGQMLAGAYGPDDRHDLDSALEDNDLREEILCDWVALHLCLSIFKSAEKVMAAGASSLHHMRFFELMDSYIPGQPVRSRQDPNVRLRLFRMLCILSIPEAVRSTNEDRDEVLQKLNQILDDCSERLTVAASATLRPDLVIATASQQPEIVDRFSNRKWLHKFLDHPWR